MTVQVTVNKASFLGSGSTGPFTFNFRFFANSEIVVKKTVLATGVTTTLTEGGGASGYSLTGAGDYSGGAVTLVTALGNGTERLTVRRVLPVTQLLDLRNQGAYLAELHEDEFDRVVMVLQQLDEIADRAIVIPESDTTGTEVELPAASLRANKALVFDADGNIDISVDDYDDQAANAAASAGAAATSESNAAASEDLSEEWATKTTGQVAATDYSSKAYAIGGTGITGLIGAAKEWAVTTGAAVIAGLYSAKEWAVGTFTRGSAGGGSAKDWANYTGGTVDNTEYSAKYYSAVAAAAAADAVATPVAAPTHAAASKATPVDADELPLIDSAASYGLKRLTWANLKAGIFSAWGALVNGATNKATPVDADAFALMDSAASNATKQTTLANIRNSFKTVFDTLYQAVGNYLTTSGGNVSGGNLLITGVFSLGYGTGAGGTVTQSTSKSTAVTLNKPTGQITMNNASLAASTTVTFDLNNSLIAVTDVLAVSPTNASVTSGAYTFDTSCGAGLARISVRNNTAGPLSEAIVLNFVLSKGASS